MQGAFSLRATGPDNLARVIFYIDGQELGEVTQPPFQLQFNTGQYSFGVHTMSAVGYTVDGRELQSNEIKGEFVSASEGTQSAMRIVIPLLLVVFGAVLLSALVPVLLGKGKTSALPLGAPRNYGALGGAICPRCERPYPRHLWALNMVVGKLDRCPYCGKWAIVRRATPAELRAAEEAELEQAREETGQAPQVSQEERLRKELDDSRYQDI